MTKYWTVLAVAALLALFAKSPVARADIYEWEYINPANPALGKQQSTMLTPDGAGVNAVPGAQLYSRNLTMAYLIGADLTGASARFGNLTNAELSQANLTSADLSGFVDYGEFGGFYPGADLTNANLNQANLSGANFTYSTLTGASLANAQVRGADLTSAFGFTATQLYSTASYLANDLTGIGLGSNDLTGANLVGQNLTNADFTMATLTNANLSEANLNNVNLYGTELTGANLTGAELRGAIFTRAYLDFPYSNYVGGITQAQLYSTASYLANDLTGIGLAHHNLAGVNLAGQDLTDADFGGATLTGTNLAGAVVRGADFYRYTNESMSLAQLYSTASYQAQDLTGIGLFNHDLTGADLTGQNLTNANLGEAKLTGANLTGAHVKGVDFGFTYGSNGITTAQLYSTASYQAHDLSAIVLVRMNLAGADLAAQDLANANFQYATLTNADLSHANLTGAKFSQSNYDYNYVFGYFTPSADLAGANLSHANLTNADFSGWEYDIEPIIFHGANLTNANLTGADARGARFEFAWLSGANTSNLIQSNGHIAGLDLLAGASLVVRDYDGNPGGYPGGYPYPPTGPLPIVVDAHLAMNATGTLRLVFDADPWDSTISFAPGIPVTLGGTLDLTFAPDVDVATQGGRTIDLFDWTGVTPTGTFTVSSPYTWDVSRLYTTGEVTLTAIPTLPGDFNQDGTVDAADYIIWRKTDGTQQGYDNWRTHFGQTAGSAAIASASASPTIPEPSAIMLLAVGVLLLSCRVPRQNKCFSWMLYPLCQAAMYNSLRRP